MPVKNNFRLLDLTCIYVCSDNIIIKSGMSTLLCEYIYVRICISVLSL